MGLILLSNLTYPTYLDDTPSTVNNSIEVGRRRVREFKGILPKRYPQAQGYEIWINRVEGRGIDVKIWKDNILDTVMELTNYDQISHMDKLTADRYLRNFKKYGEVKKIIIISYNGNIPTTKRNQFTNLGVTIEVMRYQA